MERAEPELERTARRARRVVWAFRLIFYPFAALLALALVAGRSEEPASRTLHGRTDHGRAVTLYLVDDRPASFYGSAIVTCPKNRYVQRFAASEPAVTLVFHDGVLTAGETWTQGYADGWVGHGTTTLRARVDGDTATGTLTMLQRITGPGDAYACESGAVTFSARGQR